MYSLLEGKKLLCKREGGQKELCGFFLVGVNDICGCVKEDGDPLSVLRCN